MPILPWRASSLWPWRPDIVATLSSLSFPSQSAYPYRMFVDEAIIQIKAGDGGMGCVSFRREKYVPKGGPDGGDGGNGGSIVFVADSSKDTLLDFKGKHHWKAERGEQGMGKKMAGLSGPDLVIPVPPGTLIYDAEHQILLADLDEVGRRVTVARGGKGGRGNWHFRSPTNQ